MTEWERAGLGEDVSVSGTPRAGWVGSPPCSLGPVKPGPEQASSETLEDPEH